MLNKNPKNDNNQNSALNMIGTGTTINGDLLSDGDLRIDGNINGKVVSKSKIAMGATSIINGDLKARSADISGKVDGDLFIDETLFLRSSARINGNITTSKLVIESGAEFNGTCFMDQQKTVSKQNTPLEK
jgi:cytoskeletal protein CcmA (bactofilin family)